MEVFREAVQEVIANLAPDLFITLAFNRQTSLDAVQAQLRRFEARFDDACLGGQWRRHPERRARYVGIVEHEHSNIHIHLAVRIDPDVVLRPAEIARQWTLLEQGGSIDIQSVQNQWGLGRYMAKDITPQTSHLILISENLES